LPSRGFRKKEVHELVAISRLAQLEQLHSTKPGNALVCPQTRFGLANADAPTVP
jgi:hypothetical protein